MPLFQIQSKMKPQGDQPQAIDALVEGLEDGLRTQVLLGVTGSGKTFTMANVIERVQRPTLVLAHNKTLAAQLCSEFKELFPDNAVEYFVSYYDYYQPEAYIATTDTYIEKDSSINDEIDRLRHSATAALSERRDVIIVSSVSCIYSMGDPSEYENMTLSLREGMQKDRDEVIALLVENQYDRNDIDFSPRHLPRARGRVGGLPRRPAVQGAAPGVLRRRNRPHQRIRPGHRRGLRAPEARADLPGDALRHLPPAARPADRRHRAGPGRAGRSSSATRTSSWRRSAWSSARTTTSRCCARSASARALKTIPATLTGGSRARRRSPCWTTFPRTSCSSWTSRT